MSDLQPVPYSGIENKKRAPARWVNNNKVLQDALQQFGKKERDKIVLRCDDLPSVYGSEEDFRQLFFFLLQMIMENQGDMARLYLHIHCSAEETGAGKASGSLYYSIQFNTPITLCAAWLRANNNFMNDAGNLVKKHGGSLSINTEQAGGCLFSVSLPGKFF